MKDEGIRNNVSRALLRSFGNPAVFGKYPQTGGFASPSRDGFALYKLSKLQTRLTQLNLRETLLPRQRAGGVECDEYHSGNYDSRLMSCVPVTPLSSEHPQTGGFASSPCDEFALCFGG